MIHLFYCYFMIVSSPVHHHSARTIWSILSASSIPFVCWDHHRPFDLFQPSHQDYDHPQTSEFEFSWQTWNNTFRSESTSIKRHHLLTTKTLKFCNSFVVSPRGWSTKHRRRWVRGWSRSCSFGDFGVFSDEAQGASGRRTQRTLTFANDRKSSIIDLQYLIWNPYFGSALLPLYDASYICGGWTAPFEKYMLIKLDHFNNFRVWKYKQNLKPTTQIINGWLIGILISWLIIVPIETTTQFLVFFLVSEIHLICQIFFPHQVTYAESELDLLVLWG